MVCLGNICRSPLAEGILRNKLKTKSLSWFVDSCGTANYHIGSPPDRRMIKTAASFNTDISALKARQFSIGDFENFDVIYAMDSNNYHDLIRLAENDIQKNKVHLLLNQWKPGLNLEVPDPYYGTQEDFVEVYKLLDEALTHVLTKLLHEK